MFKVSNALQVHKKLKLHICAFKALKLVRLFTYFLYFFMYLCIFLKKVFESVFFFFTFNIISLPYCTVKTDCIIIFRFSESLGKQQIDSIYDDS